MALKPALHALLSHSPRAKGMFEGGYAEGGEAEDDGDMDGMSAVAESLISAVQGGDAAGVASALRDAFELLEAEPHEEGPHESP